MAAKVLELIGPANRYQETPKPTYEKLLSNRAQYPPPETTVEITVVFHS